MENNLKGFICLTIKNNDCQVMININHISTFGATTDNFSYVFFTQEGNHLVVKESFSEIIALIGNNNNI